MKEQEILKLGWELEERTYNQGSIFEYVIRKGDKIFCMATHEGEYYIDNGLELEDHQYYFQGTIKDIDELSKLMKQVGIGSCGE